MKAKAAGALTVEIIAGYNLVVDSNVASPSTYAPSVATVIGKFCNTGDSDLTNVQGSIGNYIDGTNDTPGTYPARDSSGFAAVHPSLANSGTYAFSHVGGRIGTADATRYIGTLAAGDCEVQFWHFKYPQCRNVETSPGSGTWVADDPPCSGSPVWGDSVKPGDDLWLDFDIWAKGTDPSGPTPVSANATHRMTMRNEISAMANKIEPNPSGRWFNTDGDTVTPGETITSNGILYNLGNINKGFDNDGDYVYDYNAWLQPIGDPSYDPSCFRLISTMGVLTVTRSSGKPDLIMPFEDTLYFTNLPPDNTGAVGEVHYTFLALDGPCSTSLTPYQEVASGADNEKFNADFGSGIPPVGSADVDVSVDKSSSPSVVTVGSTFTYQIPFQNTGSSSAGLPLNNVPLVISDTVPSGLQYVGGSASSDASVTILYSTDNGATWSTTDPGSGVTTIQFRLNDPYPASASNTASFQVTVPSGYSGTPFIENTACASFGDGASFDCASTVTVVSGSNSIGDRVWQDDDGDGVQDTGETGIDGVSVSLYYDKNGDGTLDSGDVLIDAQDTAGGNGGYDFTQRPDGNYLVVVDSNDASLPAGYNLTTAGTYAVSVSGGQDYNLADFGFGPVLHVDKALASANPAYEGENLTFTIDLTNNRPGNGTGQGSSCTYTVWATSEASQSSSQPNNKRFSNSTTSFVQPTNAFGAAGPDGLYANSDFSTGGNQIIAGTGYNIGPHSGTITQVEALFQIYLDNSLVDDVAVAKLFFNGVQQGLDNTFTTAQLDAFVPASNVGFLTWDVTAVRSWAWSDFTGDLDLQYGNQKSGAADVARIFMDAMGFRITTDQTCGGSTDTVDPLPLTDTFDSSKLQFVSASPAQSGVAGGTISWSNLGPLYAGQTKQVTVTFKALEPPDTNANGEADPTTTTNTATVSGAQFTNGRSVNDASDSATVTINPAGSIGNLVWNDTDSDGVQDVGEAGIPNVTVYLCTTSPCNSSSASASDVTDANGEYLFEGLRDGTYYVGVDTATLPGTYGVSTTQTGDPTVPGANCGGSCDNQGSATLNNNNGSSGDDNVSGMDFGYAVPNVIYGNVWEDNDGDGTQDSGDNGISTVTVYLCASGVSPCNGSSASQTTTTNSSGNYSLSGMADGNYYVAVAAATAPLGSDWSNTFDPDGNTDSQSAVISVAGGNLYGAYDFGYHHSGAYAISGTVYGDWDGDSTQDVSEEGFNNVTVYLYEDSSGNGAIDSGTDALIATTTTNVNGDYSFAGLPNGSYVVDVIESSLPSQYSQTEDPDGTADGLGGPITVSGASASNIDFGYQPAGYGSIGDSVWRDDDGDGIQDSGESGIASISLALLADVNGDGSYSVVASTSSNASGDYAFTNLPPGSYKVDIDTSDTDLPTDSHGNRYVLSTRKNPGVASDVTSNDPHDVTLTSGQAYTTADFGFTAGGTIGDFLWQDNDGDGAQDSGEPGIDGVTVRLYNDANGNGDYDAGTDTLYGSDVTASGGLYEFTGLPGGKYVVVVDTATLPAGFGSTGQTGDPDENSPPACTACDSRSGLSLKAGQIDRSRDFGYRPSARIGDTLWLDTDNDGVRDGDESGIAAITVNLYDCGTGTCNDGDESLVSTTETDLDGYYGFGNLSDKTYEVRVDSADIDFPSGLQNSYDPDGTADQKSTVVVSGGSVTSVGGACTPDCSLNADFGYRYSGAYSIRGTVFYDAGNDGGLYTPASGDAPYANVTLYLWNSNRQLIASTSTAADGSYTFDSLPGGDYTVSVNQNAPNLSGTTRTTPTSNPYYTPVTISSASVANRDFGFYSTLDMGDLPAGYADTKLDDDGARHPVGSLSLGAAVDADPDGQESATSAGDTNDDGVARTPAVTWSAGTGGGSVDITVGGCTGTCYLSAWVDWGNDSSFSQTGDRILLDRAVSNGSQTITFDIPGSVALNTSYNARFRLYGSSTSGWAQPTGLATDGEVEDYQWNFAPTAVTLASFTATAAAARVDVAWATVSEVDVLGFNVWRVPAAEQVSAAAWVKLNPALIPAQSIGGVGGNGYEYRDEAVRPGARYAYKLEVVGLGGQVEWSEPVEVSVEPIRLFLPVISGNGS